MKKIHSYILAAVALLVFAPGLSAQTQTTYNTLFGDLNFPADTSGFSEESNIGFKKNISEPKDNKYWLKLEAYATGSATQTSKAVPSDVILVLDLSSSMGRDYTIEKTRLEALQDATKEFVASIKQNADEALAKDPAYPGNRISIVVYSGNTFVQTLGDGWVDVDEAGVETLNGYIDGFAVHSGTRHELALQEAIESAKTVREDAHLSVVMFTDGYPVQSQNWEGSPGTAAENMSNRFVYVIANNAVHYAHTLKDTYKATLYTVGLITEVAAGQGGYDNYRRVLYLMDILSSNYPESNMAYTAFTESENATNNAADWIIDDDGSITVEGLSTGTKDSTGDYFQLVREGMDLSNIFATIASQSGGSPAETFTEDSEAVDIVSSSFSLPPGTSASDIKVFTAPYEWDATNKTLDFGTAILAPESEDTFDDYEIVDGKKQLKEAGVDVDDAIMKPGGITVDGNSITVTGFDYADNWCGPVKNAAGDTTGAQGHKIIIMIPIVNDENAVGGPNVATNGPGSGIKDKDGNMLVHFEPPAVALPVNIQIQTTGLSVGESAKYTIKRRVVGTESWEYVTSVFVTRHKGQGDDASVFVKGLPPKCTAGNYQYMIVEDDWDWTYTLINVTGERTDGSSEPYGPDEDILTDNFAVNPITFNNSKDAGIAPKVRYSESKATNTFSTGTDEYDDFKTNTKSGRTIITVGTSRSN